MIPSLKKPKYKPLIRLRIDVWNTLLKKTFKRKKWRTILFFLKLNKKIRLKRSRFRKRKVKQRIHTLINYQSKNVSRYPVYNRYRYQKDLFLRLHIRLIYGSLQDFKIKQISLRAKKKSWLGFAQELEQKPTTFLYRSKLVTTYGEARMHYKHKRILVNGSYNQIRIKKGDILHFTLSYEKYLKRRIITNFFIIKEYKYYIKYGINQVVDFDVNSMRFFFMDDIKYFKNHPFKLHYERVIRWYTHV